MKNNLGYFNLRTVAIGALIVVTFNNLLGLEEKQTSQFIRLLHVVNVTFVIRMLIGRRGCLLKY